MRARLAIEYAAVTVHLREITLKDKPKAMLRCSPKGTVPVLVLPDGSIIDESRDIVMWALSLNDPRKCLPAAGSVELAEANRLIDENDGVFKFYLDRYKYADRYPEHSASYYREQGEAFIQHLERRLERQSYLLGEQQSVADIAIAPFIRQFAHVDKDWFESAPYPKVQCWLDAFLRSESFAVVMAKYPVWKLNDEPVCFPVFRGE